MTRPKVPTFCNRQLHTTNILFCQRCGCRFRPPGWHHSHQGRIQRSCYRINLWRFSSVRLVRARHSARGRPTAWTHRPFWRIGRYHRGRRGFSASVTISGAAASRRLRLLLLCDFRRSLLRGGASRLSAPMSISISGASMAAGAILCAGRGLGGRLVCNGFCALSSTEAPAARRAARSPHLAQARQVRAAAKAGHHLRNLGQALRHLRGAASTSGALGPAAVFRNRDRLSTRNFRGNIRAAVVHHNVKQLR